MGLKNDRTCFRTISSTVQLTVFLYSRLLCSLAANCKDRGMHLLLISLVMNDTNAVLQYFKY